MANYYLAHGAYTYAATPTWNVAQEGDGLASGTPTPATVSIDMAALTAAAGDTLAIGGATLTCVASGATTNQFNAGTGQTLADNIVTAINRTTNTVTRTASGVLTGWATPKIQDAFFARRTGTAVLEIMTRAGSATFNSTNDHRVLGTGGLSTVNSQFANGVSGAWGWLMNFGATIWPSALAAQTYGVWFSGATVKPLAGPTLTLADTVYLRADNTVVTTTTGVTVLQPTALLNLLLDDGAAFSGYTGTWTLRHSGSSGNNLLIVSQGSIVSKVRDAFVIEARGGNSNFSITAQDNVHLSLHNLKFIDVTGQINCAVKANSSLVITDCTFRVERNAAYQFLTNNASSQNNSSMYVTGCLFEWTALVTSAVAILSVSSACTGWDIYLNGCKAISTSTAPTVFNPGMAISGHLQACNMSGFSMDTLNGFLGSASAGAQPETGYVLLQNIGTGRSMRLETPTVIVDWLYNSSYPYLNSVLPDGTSWSYRMRYSNDTDAVRLFRNTPLLSLTKTYIGATGSTGHTLSVELLVDPAYTSTLTKGHIGLLVIYQDASGVVQTESTLLKPTDRYSASALDASSQTWTFPTSSYNTYVAKKLVLTTTYPIKQNTEIEVVIMGLQPAPGLMDLFINPEIGISA